MENDLNCQQSVLLIPKKWNNIAQKANGNTESIKSLNAFLKSFEQNIYQAFHELQMKGQEISLEQLKSKLTGKENNFMSLVSIFRDHNTQVAQLVGNSFSPGTLQRYETTLKHTQDFIKWKYSLEDVDITRVNHEFITSFEFYLRSVRKCANNSAIKYIKNFKKIFTFSFSIRSFQIF